MKRNRVDSRIVLTACLMALLPLTGCQGVAKQVAKEAAPPGIDQSLKTLSQPDNRALVASVLDDPPIGKVFNEFGEHIGHGIVERASAEFATALTGQPLTSTAGASLPPASQRAATPGLELGEGDDGQGNTASLAPTLAIADQARDTLRAASRLAMFAVIGLAMVLLILIAGIVLALARASQAKHRADEHDRRLTALIAAMSNTASPASRELLAALAADHSDGRRRRQGDAEADKNSENGKRDRSARDDMRHPDREQAAASPGGSSRERDLANR